MQIELSPSLDYSKVPYMVRLEPQMSIASGVSLPKIITALGSNGARFKQLVRYLLRSDGKFDADMV
jgi:ataxia telangiectasia mutated family protein